MKSKKAKEYIESKIFTARDNSGHSRFVVSIGNVKKAIEIAEEEIKEKAIAVHFKTCPHLYDRNCAISESGMCEYRTGGECKYMNEFINIIDN